jgi:hypothetical protein
MKFADIKNDVAFRKIFGNKKKTNNKWNKAELIAYDNASIAEQDEKGKIIAAKKKGKQEGKEERDIEIILEMDKEGFSIPQIARVTKKTEKEVSHIIESQRKK